MNIVFLIRSLEIGGAERQVALTAAGLHARGHTVTVVTFYEGGARSRELLEKGVRIIALRKRGRWDTIRFFVQLVRTVRACRPDFIYSFLTMSNVIARLIKPFLSAKLVWGVRASDLKAEHYDWLSRLSLWFEARLCRGADLIISNSYSGHDAAVKRGFPSGRTIVIPNGIDTAVFRPDSAARSRFRHALNLRDEDIAVGVVGRLDPMKGHTCFLEAAHLLLTHRQDMKFLCIGGRGKPAFVEELKAKSADLGLLPHILWTGELTDMLGVYNGLDILCLPSLWGEGFSNALGEAMACERICVTTDIGDSARIIGNALLVAPAGDPHALATVIERSLQFMHSGASFRAWIEENFGVTKMLTDTETALSGVDGAVFPSSQSEHESQFLDLLVWLNRHKYFLGSLSLAGAVLALAVSFFMTPMYHAQAILKPVDVMPTEIFQSQLGASSGLFSTLLGTQKADEPSVTRALFTSQTFLTKVIAQGDLLPKLYPERWNAKTRSWKDGKPPLMEEAVKKLSDRFTITELSDGLWYFEVRWETPQEAETVAKLLIHSLNDERRVDALKLAKANLDYLYQRLSSEQIQEMRQTISGVATQQLQKIMLAQGPTDFAVQVVDAPHSSVWRVSPIRKIVFLVGAIGGLFLGIFYLLGGRLANAIRTR